MQINFYCVCVCVCVCVWGGGGVFTSNIGWEREGGWRGYNVYLEFHDT